MRRRDALKLAALTAGALAVHRRAAALARPGVIVDAHIHLFDTGRPGGVPWPFKTDTVLYKPALPQRYKAYSDPYGVVGAIAIEASPLADDNRWLLDLAARNPLIVGIVGNLVPGSPSFTADLDRLHANALFLGFRYGNLWDRDLAADMGKPGFMDGLKALAQAGLTLDSANPNPSLIRAILAVAERVPGLRIVIDHLPHAPIPAEPAARDEYWANLRRLAAMPGVFIKLSEIPVVQGGKLIRDPAFYRAPLDAIWDVFGEDRILFGSDWPNSDSVAPLADTMAIVRGYISTKSPAAQEKYFWKNSIAAYRWRPRRPDQPAL
jgi:predicted TIM-barrel fold metal-dependent hydrolase